MESAVSEQSEWPEDAGVAVVGRFWAWCRSGECRLLVASGGDLQFGAIARLPDAAAQLLAAHIGLWHLGPDLCAVDGCTDMATEPAVAPVPATVRAIYRKCAEHSRIKFRNGRFVERVFCESSGCGQEAVMGLVSASGTESLCARCGAVTTEGRRVLAGMGLS